MKRAITILSLLCVLQFSAGAQWYLFPGKKKRTEPAEEKKEQVQEKPIEEVQQNEPVPAPATAETDTEDDDFFFGTPSTVGVSLILPIKAGADKPGGNFLEMYSGALLALKDIGDDGIKVNLRVVDSAEEDILNSSIFRESDVIIGPVAYSDIQKALQECGRKMLISPLEPKSAVLAEEGRNIIQAPTPWTFQVDEIVDWLQSDLQFGDEVIVLKETQTGEQGSYLIGQLQKKGIIYRTAQSASDLGKTEFKGKYRVLIASDNDSFISTSVKQIGIAATISGDVILYTTSRIRNCVSPDVLDLYNANTRLTAAYYIDYDSRPVKDFVLAYRALYGCEPGSFAFQGYDTMNYFVRMYSEYGRRWYRRLPEKFGRGLQSDFRFTADTADGRLNTAVRRIVYGKDLSMTLVQ